MTYERFSQLWDELVSPSILDISAEQDTINALVEYGEGKKEKIEEVRKWLTR